jgi:hypothetical protein
VAQAWTLLAVVSNGGWGLAALPRGRPLPRRLSARSSRDAGSMPRFGSALFSRCSPVLSCSWSNEGRGHMNRRLALSIVLALGLALGLTACGTSQETAAGGTVNGEVSGKSSGEPVQGARVIVGSRVATTDTAGRYTITGVDVGGTAMNVEAEGYGPYDGTVDMLQGNNVVNVVLEDGTISGLLKENAEVREAIKRATVTVAGQPATVQGARFEVEGVPVGDQTIEVVAGGHQRYSKKITVSPGDNSVTVKLNLTPEETYMRYYQAYRFRRYRQAYLMVHPDVQSHFSYGRFVAANQSTGAVLSIKLFGTRSMGRWSPSYAHRNYRHIVAIDRAVRYQSSSGPYTDNLTQHWQQIDGRWYIIFDWR